MSIHPISTILSAALLTAAGFSATALAEGPATDPGAIQQRDLERRRQEQLRRAPDATPVLPGAVPRPRKGKPGAADLTFGLKRIAFDGSRVFSPQELAVIARKFEGRTVTFAELEDMIREVDAGYAGKGHPIFHAVIPPQKVKDGVLKVRLVEVTFEAAKAKGNVQVRDGFVTAHIHQAPGDLLDTKALQRDLLLLKRGQDLDVQADLVPGKAYGTSDVIVNVHEDKPWMVRVFADNYGSCNTGEFRVGLQGSYRNLFGVRDDVWAQTTKSEGDINFGGGARFPINTWGGRAGVSFIQDETKIVGGDFASLGITGVSRLYSTDVTQPVYVTEALFISATAGAKARQSASRTADTLTSETFLYAGQAGVVVDLLPSPELFVRFMGDFASGVNEAEDIHSERGIVRGGRQEYQCVHLVGYGSYAFSDGADIRLSTSATLAVGGASLPSAEQFAVGGAGSVRGYCTGVTTGDSGCQASLEFRRRLGMWEIFDDNASLVGSVFHDAGMVDPYDQVLQGTGIGLEAQFSSHANLRVEYAHGWVRTPGQDGGYDRIYCSFGIQY